jgi:surface protein
VATCHINTWNVSLATDMSDLFRDETSFNRDIISTWDVSSVTAMGYSVNALLCYVGNVVADISWIG